jgi:chromosome segregation ATPase
MAAEPTALKDELVAVRRELATQTQRTAALSASLMDAKASARDHGDRCQRLEAEAKELRSCKLQWQSLEGTVEALQHELQRLKSARSKLDADLKEARGITEAQARQIAQLQGSAALAKAKLDDQSTQLRVMKQQLLDMEEEVRYRLHVRGSASEIICTHGMVVLLQIHVMRCRAGQHASFAHCVMGSECSCSTAHTI